MSFDNLDTTSPIPLYHQLFSNLSRRIHSGELPNGYKLPSESTLAVRLGVSRITVKRALNELASNGLVSRKRGSGTQVTLNTALTIKGGVQDMISNVTAIRRKTNAKLLDRQRQTIPANVYSILELSQDDDVEQTAHTLLLNNSPVTLTLTYAPANLVEHYEDKDIERESLITLMNNDGIRIVKANQTLSAIAASQYHADIFSIPVNSPLLEIQCVMFNHQGVPCQFVMSYFQPEFYRYEMTLI